MADLRDMFHRRATSPEGMKNEAEVGLGNHVLRRVAPEEVEVGFFLSPSPVIKVPLGSHSDPLVEPATLNHTGRNLDQTAMRISALNRSKYTLGSFPVVWAG